MRGNTVYLHLNRGRTAVSGCLYQYDRGQHIVFDGVTLPNTYEVHFANDESGQSKPMIGDASGVDIPDEYLTSGQPVHVWVYVVGEDHAETEYHGIINVKKRAEPTDIEPTPEQQTVIDQTIAALNSAVEVVGRIADDVEETVQDAIEDAKESGLFDGPPGPKGDKGDPGEKGDTGATGAKGDKGDKGDTGAQGAKGDKGDTGATGAKGDKGDPGATGAQGEKGDKGDKGDPGTTDYSDMTNKPQIAGVTLSGNKSLSDLGIASSADLAGKIDEPQTEGTSGQVLTTDGNGGRTWTTVQGGGGTSNYSDLSGKPQIAGVTLSGDKSLNDLGIAAAIVAETESTQSHSGLQDPHSIKFLGNALAFKNARYADAVNVCPDITGTKENKGVSAVFSHRFIQMSGTCTSGGAMVYYEGAINEQPAGTYNVIVEVSAGESVLSSSTGYFGVSIRYSDEQSDTGMITKSISTSDKEWTFTATKAFSRIKVSYPITNGSVYSDFVAWVGIFPSTATITDVGETVPASGYLNHDVSGTMTTIDTLQHHSVISSIADTKTYIDNHLPADMVTEADLVYLSPEMFGAVGNDSTDDTTALQACIDAALAQGKAIRGFGNYRTTATLSIDGQYLNAFFKAIRYTGTGPALTIAGKYHVITVNRLTAASTGGEGVHFIDSSVTDITERIFLEMAAVSAYNSAIRIITSQVPEDNKFILYTVIRSKLISSQHDDAITSTGRTAEISVYDARFNCPEGWCFNGNTIKLFNCTMESNCWGGVYGLSATIQNCRARELMDAIMPSNPRYGLQSGTLFKAKSYTYSGINIELDDFVYYESIDLSDAVVSDTGDSDASDINAYTGIVRCQIIMGDQTYRNGRYILGKEMILHGKDKICVPQYKSKYTVTTANFDLRDTAFQTWAATRPYYPTHFVVDVDNCVIHLAPSYCAEGYSEFEVDMSTKKADVYDRRGNLIFDSSLNTTGVYKFEAIVDHTVDDVYQTDHSGQFVYPINSGYCDVWTVTNLSASGVSF